ncbi:SubName: Full=Uncharacterized protein {ECO:0000313/EMBL:CCA73525.1} [Serendipita indica DSM 11827]|uniref:DUF2264 domain-containing protein n=1 Tax=Serendipita indica (strain DSM 11827) TaxID=1109443 RepID=G4TQD2_SERID|nr:SubName: Full=Uncharacterized protein {ECO:0000313/EMBL:CCA73525.1} [Serendipita indica DSM 11827]CCA73525.1 hypothetical protein PIIN_07478 [Serendipita indica DSM 11827]
MNPLFDNPLETRDDLGNALRSMLDPLAHFTSPGGARVNLGATATHFDTTAAALEGFSRPLWGLSSLLAGGGEYPGVERWIKGFENGTDPTNETEFWGMTRGKDQRMVEMAAIGFTLAVAKEHIWDKMNENGRNNLTTWLNCINDKDMPNTNWLWFRVFANLGLRSVGRPYSEAQLKADLDHLDTFYIGNGWSRDGPPGVLQLDYYSSSFAIHFAQLVYSKLAAKEDPERCEEYRDRARKFAVQFVHYFDEEGRAIPFGRSLTYRFATTAFWGALAYADVLPPAPLNSWGIIKGLHLRNIRYHARLPIFTSSGILTIGYAFPNMFFTENYNSPGSTYWACKGFLPLAVPADHPFWTSAEEPYPTSSIPRTMSLDHPSHILTHSGGHTFLLSSGQACHYPLRHGAEKYGKLAYSAAFGYSVPTGAIGLDMWNPDSTIALSEDGGERWVVRRHVEVNDSSKESGGFLEGASDSPSYTNEGGDENGWLRAIWRPWKATSVETWLIPPHPSTPLWHIRIHRIKRDAVRLGGEVVLVSDAGFAMYSQDTDGRTLSLLDTPEVAALNKQYGKVEGVDERGAYALVRSAAGVSGVYDLTSTFFPSSGNLDKPAKSVTNASNYSSLSSSQQKNQEYTKRRAQIVHLDSNSNIVSSRSCMPALIGQFGTEDAGGDEDIWLATGVFALPTLCSARGVERSEAQVEGFKLDWLDAWNKRPASLPALLQDRLS